MAGEPKVAGVTLRKFLIIMAILGRHKQNRDYQHPRLTAAYPTPHTQKTWTNPVFYRPPKT
ncbi:hypothetical protein NG798_27170 [Ancylothrix sp. C2]|uniref:hypothetical protein n=1 Tax=Ancylothrix sp. D3o TaxID=2953691 RepID=UPI0021BAD969|nr:hypothetical protein [Ancylothrix sp. D3o]MCT7953485.1 hypothetical protein [Ancylothrix sp. D3o]